MDPLAEMEGAEGEVLFHAGRDAQGEAFADAVNKINGL